MTTQTRTTTDLDAGRCACWESCPNDAEPDSDMCAECLSEGCPGGKGDDGGPIEDSTMTTAEPTPDPCQCHTTFAYISPMHEGHCCFQPATQTCHPAEVAAWEAEAPFRRGEKARS